MIHSMRQPFLTATWNYLLNVTYRVPPELLLPHVPKGVDLDVQEGTAFASIVAFHFLNTRVKGIKIPFHVNFPEINLRYYVQHQGRRGVVFWKELVPRTCIALVANRLYNEPYQATDMQVQLGQNGEQKWMQHDFRYAGRPQRIRAQFKENRHVPTEESVAHYFKEHNVGFGVNHRGQTLAYDVIHPHWAIYDLQDWRLDLDFGLLYGPQWEFLSEAQPHAALLAEGSEVAVYPPQPLARTKSAG
jgi:uncharacterized protein